MEPIYTAEQLNFIRDRIFRAYEQSILFPNLQTPEQKRKEFRVIDGGKPSAH